MLFIFSTPVLIKHLWQLKTVVFLRWCLMCAVPYRSYKFDILGSSKQYLFTFLINKNIPIFNNPRANMLKKIPIKLQSK